MIVGGENKNFTKNDDIQKLTYKSTNKSVQYAVMRVGQKYFTSESIEAFEYHMERQGQILNADSTKSHENRIIIGDENIFANLEKHIEGVWRRKDSCIARDMVLTASPDFFRGISELDFEKWINLNRGWLIKTYGANVIYCVLHMD